MNACIRGFVEGEARPRAPWEFRRSKPALDPVIVRVALSKGEKAPHFTTVLNWFDLWMTLGDIHGKACLVDRHQHKGNRRRPFGHVGEVALERGVWRWLSPNMTTEVAYAKVVTSVGPTSAPSRAISRRGTRPDPGPVDPHVPAPLQGRRQVRPGLLPQGSRVRGEDAPHL